MDSLSSSSEERESLISYRRVASEVFARAIGITLTFVVVLVGSIAGAITGALTGFAGSESGLVRSSAIGAISGAVFSIEVVQSSLDLWNSRESGIWTLLYLLDIVSSLARGRLVTEKVGPAVRSAIQRHTRALSFESLDLFESGATIMGMPLEEVEKLPKCKTSAKDSVDASGEKIGCSVCLQGWGLRFFLLVPVVASDGEGRRPMSLFLISLTMAAQSPAPDPDFPFSAWYGNIQYLLNISAAGAASCVLLFLLVKLRYDHRRFPGPSALGARLLAVYHATPAQIALHCGADAAQFLIVERASFFVLLAVSLITLLAAFPINLSGSVPLADPFARTTISHIHSGSPILWLHFLLAALIVFVSHLGISRMEDDLSVTRFRDGNGNPSESNSGSIAIFTMMVQGVPKSLASNKAPLEEFLQHRYPGKVYRVVVPFDLCTLEYLTLKWTNLQNEISWLETHMHSRSLLNDDDDGHESSQIYEHAWLRKAKEIWAMTSVKLGFTQEERFRKLQSLKLVLQNKLSEYKEGRAPGAGIAFVVFKDAYTANKAVRDLRSERKRRSIGQFVPVMELQLGRSRWRVERAPPAVDIYWNHLGLNKLSLRLRKIAVNACLLLMLLFFSSPLAIINAMSSAARIINAGAVDHANSWLNWLEGSSWFGALILQFLPNVLVFVSLYIVIPSALSYLSKFECHLTVSGEQRSAMLKMVCFFLVNLILLRAMVESTLENAILRMGRCYLDGEDCKQIEQYMSASFLTRSCLATLAFLITSTFLGISFDLLAPVPWMKNILKKFKKNDMVQLVPEQTVESTVEQNGVGNNLRMPLISEREGSLDLNGLEVHDLSVYPTSRSFHTPKQTFDFAQYYAFNLTIFTLTMIYSLFAPLVVPVGAIYFGYRYMVDKYNFLFVYRARGFPAGNDGKLIDRVSCIMHFCVVLFLLSMVFFFSVQGDFTKLQATFTLGLLFVYKVLPTKSDACRPALLEGIQTVDSFVDGPTDYEVFSNINLDWVIHESQS
ncbi:hypothetical protein ZIOFF_065757 [Zingiber officinale]|uniref:CSC1-like protein n=2 Tax=Zingiber officinale TaxID=94328 RepID=A0A8J5EXS8_ZINOF|nr:hypothetical protein ZIOFF_065757 [Zingiber officinale]